jgi:SAM-dependent methyltransferase
MRTDILDITAFYASPLGRATKNLIGQRLEQAWGDDVKDCRVAGFGYTEPYLELFGQAERCLSLVPEGMGVLRATGMSATCMTGDSCWPLPDASMDRILLVHGLEETSLPRKLLREVWRVLADDGRVIIVVPNRRGLWAMAEATPFSSGRPFLRGQLGRLLTSAMFTPSAWSSALYMPPMKLGFLIKAAGAWERAGGSLWPAFGGVTLVEARKEIAVPAGGSKAEVLKSRVLRPVPNTQVKDVLSGKEAA